MRTLSAPSDRARFQAVVLPYLEAARAAAAALVDDDALADDAVQDAMLDAYARFGAFHGHDPKSWLLTIVRNKARSAQHAAGLRACPPAPGVSLSPPHSPETRCAQREAIAQVRRTLAAMSPPMRESVHLAIDNGMSRGVVAGLSGCTEAAAASRLARARRRFRNAVPLKPWD